jgi:hypothetical protein
MYRYQNQAGDIVEAVLWDGAGWPNDRPEWLASFDGKLLHEAYSMMQSNDLLFINTPAAVQRVMPGEYVVYDGQGTVTVMEQEAFSAIYTLVPEPEPEPAPEESTATEPPAP